MAAIAAPWRFSGFPEEARAMLARLWAGAAPTAAGARPAADGGAAERLLEPRSGPHRRQVRGLCRDASRQARRRGPSSRSRIGRMTARRCRRRRRASCSRICSAADLHRAGRMDRRRRRIDPAALPCPCSTSSRPRDRIVPGGDRGRRRRADRAGAGPCRHGRRRPGAARRCGSRSPPGFPAHAARC